MRRALAMVGLAALPAAAWACGVCIEDKIAATYDYSVVTQAKAHHRVVVFAAVETHGDAASEAQALKRAAARMAGIDASSIRTASAPAALSFALDAHRASPAAALAALERTSGASVKLTLLRVMR